MIRIIDEKIFTMTRTEYNMRMASYLQQYAYSSGCQIPTFEQWLEQTGTYSTTYQLEHP
jgi:hypothetical protein